MTPPTPRRPKTRRAKPAATTPAALTVAQLRELAQKLGVRGYSRMRKDELEQELAARGQITAPQPTAAAVTTTHATTRTPAPAQPSAAAVMAPSRAPAATLNEHIDQLPQAREPQLGLLPQRPGVVQAYWVLPLELTRSLPPLQLRLMRVDTPHDPLIAEMPVAAGSGHHYFNIADDIDPGAVYLQLGYYDSGRQFVNAIGRSLARVPSLYAAREDQPGAQLSEAQFRALYLRAGGFEHGERLGWSASTSSPAAPFSAPSSPPFNR